jgi:hypothetical protein
MTVKVSFSSSQDITFSDSKADFHDNPTQCGPRVYTFTGGMPPYLSLNALQTILNLSTNDVSHKGTHSIEFTVKLANFTGVAGITKKFQVIITCEVLTLAFTTTPANIFIEPGVTTGVTSQPQTTYFAISQTPNCSNPQTFTFISVPPSFVSITNILENSGSI